MLAVDAFGKAAPVIRPGTTFVIDIGTVANISPVTSSFLVRLISTADCHIAISDEPTATTSDMLVRSGVVEYFAVKRGDRISVIRSTANGLLYITQASEF
jgi:hypothetical protein